MSAGLGLLRAVLSENITPSELREAQITAEKFIGDEVPIFECIIRHQEEYGRYPQIRTIEVETEQQDCFADIPDEPFGYWTEQVTNRWAYRRLDALKSTLQESIGTSPIENILSEIDAVQSEIRNETTFSDIKEIGELHGEVLEQHDRIQQMEQILGIPFGFPYIDGISGGSQAGDVIVVAGKTSVGKSQLVTKFGREAYMGGYNVLSICTEMPEKQVARRDLAALSSIDSNVIKMGTLSGFGREQMTRKMNNDTNYNEEGENYYRILPGGIYGKYETIVSVCKEMRPDLLLIDGAALIRMDKFKGGRWERMIEIVEHFKHLALEMGIRIVLTYHFGKQGAGTPEGIYGGLAMSQFASMIMSFEYETEEDAYNPSPIQYRVLHLIKGRDGEKGKLRLLFDMTKTALTQDEVIEGEDMDFEEIDESDYEGGLSDTIDV